MAEKWEKYNKVHVGVDENITHNIRLLLHPKSGPTSHNLKNKVGHVAHVAVKFSKEIF